MIFTIWATIEGQFAEGGPNEVCTDLEEDTIFPGCVGHVGQGDYDWDIVVRDKERLGVLWVVNCPLSRWRAFRSVVSASNVLVMTAFLLVATARASSYLYSIKLHNSLYVGVIRIPPCSFDSSRHRRTPHQ